MITLIAAVAANNVIGSQNDLPWYLPADLKHFKDMTTGHTVIMGRKTYDSIYARLKGPLPNRINVVITRDTNFNADDVKVFQDLEHALEAYPEVFVIGGASLFSQTIDRADKLALTEVHADIPGDTYFPTIDPNAWKEISRVDHDADEKNQFGYSFVTYEHAS
jgi:dihydrofolate reductase